MCVSHNGRWREDTGEIPRRAVHGRHSDHRGALDPEAEPRSRAEADVDAAGGQRLLQLGVAPKARHGNVEAFARENLGVDPDLGRPEREGIGHRFAEADGVEG